MNVVICCYDNYDDKHNFRLVNIEENVSLSKNNGVADAFDG